MHGMWGAQTKGEEALSLFACQTSEQAGPARFIMAESYNIISALHAHLQPCICSCMENPLSESNV